MLKRLKWDNKQYQIYALIDPRDNTIRYVGMSDDAQYRFYQHLQCIGIGERERQWIKELQQLNLSLTLQILETVDPNIQEAACEREKY